MENLPPPLAGLPLRDATGDVRAVYDALAAALGVRLVNLVYRHLATVPGCLEWAWSTVGDDFRTGRFAGRARELTRICEPRDAPVGPGISLRACGLDAGDGEAVHATLDAYNRANPMNAISLSVISIALAEGRPAGPFVAPDAGGNGRGDGLGGELPDLLPLAPLDGLPGGTAALLLSLADATAGPGGATGGGAGDGPRIVPSLFRHFTAWPALLEAISAWLGPVAASGHVDALSARISGAAAAIGREMFENLPAPGDGAVLPDGKTRTTLAATVAVFPPAICRMTVVGTLLRGALRP